MLTIREQQIGLLEVIGYVAAIIAVVGAVAWDWNLMLLLGVILAALLYAVFREIRNLEQGNDGSCLPRQTIPKQRSASKGRTTGRPVVTETKHPNRVVRMGGSNNYSNGTERNSA